VGSARAFWKWVVQVVLTMVVTISLTSCARVKHENDGRVVLPSYNHGIRYDGRIRDSS
jgi:hypothetical protein